VTALAAISELVTALAAISESPTAFRARSIAARPPPARTSSRTSAERTPFVSLMSLVLTSPLTTSSLNTVSTLGSAAAVPPRATKSARYPMTLERR
jgi:hypothetical protein